MTATQTEQPIGYLINSRRFECVSCAKDRHCRVYRVNIGIYSQQCATCKCLIVDGVKKSDKTGPLNIFDEGL